MKPQAINPINKTTNSPIIYKSLIFLTLAVIIISLSIYYIKETNPKEPNILLIIVDDLRPQLMCYGELQMKTPNIDKLAKEGVLFTMAYCQVSSCLPTRQSFLTGLRPDSVGINDFFRVKYPSIATLPEYFKKYGYYTVAAGKVFHYEDFKSWSEPYIMPQPFLFLPEYRQSQNVEIQLDKAKKKITGKYGDLFWQKSVSFIPAAPWEINDLPDLSLYDGRTIKHTILKLSKIKNKKFFLAVGLTRPHLPFIAPKKYYDLYPRNEIKPPENNILPKGAPRFIVNPGKGELLNYSNVEKDIFTNKEKQKDYIRGYYASVSYVDALIGTLLSHLKKLGLDKNTVVILVGDHGYHLFEGGTFGKNNNFERATRVPLIIKYPPNVKRNAISNTFVELIDLFPTLCKLASLPIPDNIDGTSFLKTLKSPNLKHKSAIYHQMPAEGNHGRSVRTESFRYTEWERNKKIVAKELYEYLNNSQDETENLADDPKYKDKIDSHSELLRKVFKV